MTNGSKAIVVAAVLLSLTMAPLLVGPAGQNILTKMLIASLFATGFNLLLGQAGLLSFGHAAFFGMGAIATLHVMAAIESKEIYLPLPLLPFVGAVAGFLVAVALGLFATRRSGTYFALVTLAMAELIHVIAPIWQSLFGGEAGLTSMRMPSLGISFDTPAQVYLLTLIWSVLGIVLLLALSRTAFGQLTLALKGNEQRLRFLGFDTYRSKVAVFAISGMISGLAGSLLAISSEAANYTLFSIEISTQVVFYAYIGGTAYFFGPAIAAAALVLLPYHLSNYTNAWPLYQGLIFMVVILATPNGIGGVLSNWLSKTDTLANRQSTKRLVAGFAFICLTAVIVETAMRRGVAINPAAIRAEYIAVGVATLFGVAVVIRLLKRKSETRLAGLSDR